jgi:hypothetical protein
MYGLTDAWREWLAGHRVENAVYGVPHEWWARGGNSLEFLAALSIIADVLGPQRLRQFGKSLHGLFSYGGAWTLVVDTFHWLRLVLASIFYHFTDDKQRSEELSDKAWQYPAPSLLNALIILIPVVMTWHYARSEPGPMDPMGAFFASMLAGGLVMLTIAPFITVATLLALSALGVLCDALLIKPAAWILEREGVERRIKIIAAVLLVVGFSFDLLFTP